MIEFDIIKYKTRLGINPRICQKFEFPIIFYLGHKNDSRFFFLNPVIFNPAQSELSYIFSYSPANKKKIELHEDEKLFKAIEYYNPHCTIQINGKGDFITFFENSKFFFQTELQRNCIKAYTGKDLKCQENNNFLEFGSTFYKDHEKNDCLYFTGASKNGENKLLNYYKASLDLDSIEKIFEVQLYKGIPPHATRKYKNLLLNSEFLNTVYRLDTSGEIIPGTRQFLDYVYEDLYREYCAECGKKYSEEVFKTNNKINIVDVHLEKDFAEYCSSKGKNIFEICQGNDKYRFSVLPGKISVINLLNQGHKFFETTFCAPAHFEIDYEEGFCYASSHNFVCFDKLYFLGPAAIDKFKIDRNGQLKKISTFIHPTGYRFTNHRIFKYKGKQYICAFGQPNRLFFIDAEKMNLLYYYDFEEDVISPQEDLRSYINNNNLSDITFLATEASQDGEMLFIPGPKHLYFFSFPERKIISKIKYLFPLDLSADLRLEDFYRRTTHTNYLY